MIRSLLAAALALAPCAVAGDGTSMAEDVDQPRPYVRIEHPDWIRDAAIYQLNTRQFTVEGTLRAAQEQLPRIRALGTDVVWLMPIHPIGEKNRKGTLGSPYAVRDYYEVNPEFGTLEDLRAFVRAAHGLGMRVILDWVANHTAWDNALVERHPDWYERDWDGGFRPTPWWDWSDIIDLDYRKPAVRRYMIEAMKYWVREADVDGFRCDVAAYLPLDFWEQARRELDAIKPVFLLAEAEFRDLHAAAFDASYAWSWHDAVHRIGHGKGDVTGLYRYYSENESAWPRDALRMTFVSNHDKNSWEGTQFELMGDALDNAVALSVLGEGIPLVYNGQEAGNRKRLEFFEKDPIEWREHAIGDLYARLLALKKAHSPLWNGAWGARMEPVVNDAPARVLSFVRRDENTAVLGLFNFSGRAREVRLLDGPFAGAWRDALSDDSFELAAGASLPLEPWSFRVLLRRDD